MSLVIDIRRDHDSATVVLRPYPMWRTAGIFAAVAILAGSLTMALSPHSVVARLLRVAMFSAFGLSVYGVLLASAWYRFGREIVRTTEKTLSIEHRIGPRRVRLTAYSADRVQNLRAVGVSQVVRRGRPVSPVAPALAFDYEGQNVRFGGGLAGAEADSVVDVLKSVMQTAP